MTLDKFASVPEINAFLGGVGRGEDGKGSLHENRSIVEYKVHTVVNSTKSILIIWRQQWSQAHQISSG